MNASHWLWRLLCAAGVVAGFCLAGPSWADDKGKKDSDKGKEEKQVIVIQLDVSKASPALIKQLMELAKSTGKDDGDKKKDSKKDDDDDDDKKKDSKKDDDKKKDDGKKPNIVQVDLNKLPPGLAKQIMAELAKSKGKGDDKKKDSKKDDDDDDDNKKKSSKKDDDDEDDKKKGGKKKDD
jgi:hypothetical protein